MKRWLIAAMIVCGCETAHQAPAPPAANEIVATILTPDGKPAAGAAAVLVLPGHTADISSGEKFDDDPTYQRCTAGVDGRIHFHPTTQPYLIVAIHPSGYVQFNQREASPQMHLQAWGRIEGSLRKGDKPDAGQQVVAWHFAAEDADRADAPQAMYESEVKADDQGNFVMPRAATGKTSIAPDYKFSWGQPERPLSRIDVKPNTTTPVAIGGRGRPVVGKVQLPSVLTNRTDWWFWLCMIGSDEPEPTPPMPQAVKNGSLVEQANWWEAFDQTAAGKNLAAAKEQRNKRIWATMHGFDVQPDGSFRIEDVTAGTYYLHLNVMTKQGANQPSKPLGFVNTTFTVPPLPGDRSDEPLTIPTLQLQLRNAIGVGDAAPDFSVQTLDDQPLRLADFRGKVVLLEFWATWCGPCVAETDSLKDLYNTFAGNPRFAMISLSMDSRPDEPIAFVAHHGIKWHEGYLGNAWDHPLVKAYGVEGIPCFWIIGPDGEILAKPDQSEKLKPAIMAALQK
jgi:peroxiredoxin